MISEQKKKILAYLEKNPGASILKMHAEIDIPEWTTLKLVTQLVDERMVVKVRYGWKIISGQNLIDLKVTSPIQTADKHIREMVRSGLQK